MSHIVYIVKKFKGFELDVSFNTKGERLGILGPSGSGKSLILKCIAGIEKPDKGLIVVNDRVFLDTEKNICLSPQERKAGYLFQSYALFPHMSVEKNLAMATPLKGKDKKEHINSFIGMLRLNGLEKLYPSQLSAGQQQRVAIGRILISKPDIMLLDEPFSALDAYLKDEIQLELLKMAKEYPGDIVMVTHNRDEAYQICDSLIVMHNGKIVSHGNTKSLFENTGDVMGARLTGCKNIVKAKPMGKHKVYVEDWGCEIQTALPVKADISHIGVRAHHWEPAYENGSNVVVVKVNNRVENPFDWDVLFNSEKGSKGKIWWKHSKEKHYTAPPGYLYVSPEKVMLLKGEYTD